MSLTTSNSRSRNNIMLLNVVGEGDEGTTYVYALGV